MTQDWLDSKRLVGPNVGFTQTGALLEVAGEGPEFDQRLQRWEQLTSRLAGLLGWEHADPVIRRFTGGALLLRPAPPDLLFTATEVNEEAWSLAGPGDADPAAFDAAVQRLAAMADNEGDAAARSLYYEARRRGISCLLDDAGISLGQGRYHRFWAKGSAPPAQDVPWSEAGNIPVALVTGTNGKTTTTRMLAAILQHADYTVGTTSTGGLTVNGQQVEQGDYSGPGGACQLLRNDTVDAAVLETARGGLLRRGMAVDKADVAVITNIAEDHLGDGGIETLEDLAEVKSMVLQPVAGGGTAVLNADDEYLTARGVKHPGAVIWFSMLGEPQQRGDAIWLDGDSLLLRRAGQRTALLEAASIPATLGGAARHNIANALAAAGAALALGVAVPVIQQALREFGSQPDDNPGRAELVQANGAHFIIDFAHNPDGFDAILATARSLCSGRLGIAFGQAGDRTDMAIADLCAAAVRAGCDFFIIKDMEEYRRGRKEDEVPTVIVNELKRLGVDDERIRRVASEEQAAVFYRQWAEPGDAVALFVHSHLPAVRKILAGGS